MRGLYLTHPNPLMAMAADKVDMHRLCDYLDTPIRPPALYGAYDDPRDLDLSDLPEGYGFQFEVKMIDTTENESLVHRARNVAVGRFMQKTDADLFLFIDADIDFDPEAVVRLVESAHDISCACYPKKVVMWDQAKKAVEEGDDRPMAMLSSSLVINFGAQSRQVVDGFIEILDGPTGFMMIKREVFKKLEDAFPELWCKNDHQNRPPNPTTTTMIQQ